MDIIRRIETYQAHPVPKHASYPRGPFPPELMAGPEMNYDSFPAYPEDGSDFQPGATAQNNFQGFRWLRCSYCHGRVKDYEAEDHVCEE